MDLLDVDVFYNDEPKVTEINKLLDFKEEEKEEFFNYLFIHVNISTIFT